jgi:hypothetical protein
MFCYHGKETPSKEESVANTDKSAANHPAEPKDSHSAPPKPGDGSHSATQSIPAGQTGPGGANTHSDYSAGSRDAASSSAQANKGVPGVNRTVVGDDDSAEGFDTAGFTNMEHMSVAEEQRIRSDAYVDGNKKYAQQRYEAAKESGIAPGGQGWDPERGNYSTGEGYGPQGQPIAQEQSEREATHPVTGKQAGATDPPHETVKKTESPKAR